MPQRKPKDVLDMIKAEKIRLVDVKFTDLLGTLQHFTLVSEELDAGVFERGLGFDGSSIRGFQHIHESDMLLVPDPDTAFIDPVMKDKTLSLICDIIEPIHRERYSRDPRYIATKAEAYLQQSRLADVSYWGPEMEFFLFDSLRFDQNSHESYYHIESEEGIWNSGSPVHSPSAEQMTANVAYRPRHKEGYFPAPPVDSLQDIRSEVLLTLMDIGVRMEIHHHEVATAGQGEFDIKYAPLRKQADNVILVKYIARNVAKKHGKLITFMPKPLFGDNGTGMHVHQSLWKAGKNVFYDPKGYGLISKNCKYYIGGLLKHAHALMAICAPTTNSYRRLVPGYEAPVNLAYSQRNRSACVRIPVYATTEVSKRIEFRPPDATANPYLAFPAMLMAGIDGIINKIDPGAPLDADIYELPKEELAKIRTVPGSLEQALNALEQDHDFLLRGGVFTQDFIDTWVEYKRLKEVDAVRLRPHPYEFFLYSDY